MPNILISAWVKKVYNQRTDARKTGVVLSPINTNLLSMSSQTGAQTPVIHLTTLFLNTPISTVFLSLFNLLSIGYTHNPQPLLLGALKKNKER